ncbi:unnamed protein product [Ceutorhynchus assimilis]|uniref:DUF4789 domain-containing protein n=1 Tax=Ceutorhynchus assimilis TaxID=467358 RepID=A0A9N9Q8A6_9CUCU|nr:unnamed protein product [Ceutorhynchus assimilis]
MPLFVPGRCAENELLYPAEANDEWICDCGPGFIYHSEKDTCFAALRQGPCNIGQHLILKSSQSVPECAQNPCQDGFARYEDKCYELGTPNGPCLPILQGGGIFDVNVSTLRAECLKGTDPLSLFSLPSRCTPGSRRDRNGNCRVIYD